MCRIFAGQDPADYEYITRSLRLAGHATSIRLEATFWDILEELAASLYIDDTGGCLEILDNSSMATTTTTATSARSPG